MIMITYHELLHICFCFLALGDINIMGVDLATPECQHMGVAMATNYQVVFQVFIEVCNLKTFISSPVV